MEVARRVVDSLRSGGRRMLIRSERQLELYQASLPYRRLSATENSPGSQSTLDKLRKILPQRRPVKLDLETMAKFYPPRPEFHALKDSPSAELREMAKHITQFSSCPSCLAINDRLPEEEWNDIENIPGGTYVRAADILTLLATQQLLIRALCRSRREKAVKSRERPEFTCPDCGFPTHCSHEHWLEDREAHSQICGLLRQWVEDEHDARSGRKRWEMNFPGMQEKNAYLNFTNWPHLLATRKFAKPILQNSIVQRHISQYLTYPYTIASMIFNPWIYYDEKVPDSSNASVVTQAGWHLISSLSHALEVATKSAMAEYDRMKNKGVKAIFVDEPTSPLLVNDPFRVFILGPRVENQLPEAIWEQLNLSFPGVPFRLYFIGPESVPPRLQMTNKYSHIKLGTKRLSTIYSTSHKHERPINSLNPNGEMISVNSVVYPVSVNLRMEYIASPFEQVAEAFGPFRRNRDIFVLFNSGVGHYRTREQWRPALDAIFKTRCLTIFTSLNSEDQKCDIEAIQEDHDGKYIVAVRPTRNKFASMRPVIPVDSVHEPDQWVYGNHGLFALHGIGTEVGEKQEEVFLDDPFKKSSWFSWSW